MPATEPSVAVVASGSFVVLAVCLVGRVEGEGGEGEEGGHRPHALVAGTS
jgi:hypothetical protein